MTEVPEMRTPVRAGIRRLRPPSWLGPGLWPDVCLAALLAVGAGTASLQGARRIDPVALEYKATDTWFEADLARVFANMTRRGGDHYRTNVHPLFSLLANPSVKFVHDFMGISWVPAVRISIAEVAAFWSAAFYLLIRLAGLRRLDAVLFTLLALASASAVFWFTVPETYSFGSVSLLFALIVVAVAERRQISIFWHLAANVLSLSFTVTNWMAGIAGAFLTLRLRRALTVTAGALAIVFALGGLQKLLFPSAGQFFTHDGEEQYFLHHEAGGALAILSSFVFHSMAVPAFREVPSTGRPEWPRMLTQGAPPGSGSAWGLAAVWLWPALLGLGAWGLWRLRERPRLRAALVLTLLGQLCLHLLYGSETFLYSCHFGPLLVAVAAAGALTPARPLVLLLAGALVVCAATNNLIQFEKAAGYYREHGDERHLVLAAMRARPEDPWPRGDGHVVLAIPGSELPDKAYHEPGGSFSPAVGSFGISVWIAAADGRLLATSDSVPLTDVHQRFEWRASEVSATRGAGGAPSGGGDGADGPASFAVPAVVTDTPWYRASWSWEGAGRWRLLLDSSSDPQAARLALAIRSVGPAGGPVREIDWDGEALTVNGRWRVRVTPPPARVHVGEERGPDWKTAAPGAERWAGSSGWGHARLELEGAGKWEVSVADGAAEAPGNAAYPAAVEPLDLEVPDEEFVRALRAQSAHLIMSCEGGETRSSDPVNVPVAWQRTGAYIITALAASGNLETARELCHYLAENDFYGGFGSEADAPGLGIWALAEVNARLGDPGFEREVLPHVRRKADLILKMLSAHEPFHEKAAVPVVPKYRQRDDITLVADPARHGLISGRMDFHRPLLYINAVSYRGLLDAAGFAGRAGEEDDARRWGAAAAGLADAWREAFEPPQSDNDRTYISALWPTWIGVPLVEDIRLRLEERWRARRSPDGAFLATPLWTYFEVAEAHQWLFLGQVDRVWTTVRWFFDHQASPGLYTWWEDAKEGNAYDGWQKVRGWVQPPNSQPHYWTSAEMLLLLLDMLVYADFSRPEPELVIGAGVKPEWLASPMSVRGVRTRLGRVDWSWRDGAMTVILHAGPHPVRLGPAFPAGTRIEVRNP